MITKPIDTGVSIPSGQYVKVLTAPDLSLSTTVNLRIVSGNLTQNAKIRVANCHKSFANGSTPPAASEWIHPLDIVLGPAGIRIGIMEDTGLVLGPDRCLVVYCDQSFVSAHCFGFYKDGSPSLAVQTKDFDEQVQTLGVLCDARFDQLNRAVADIITIRDNNDTSLNQSIVAEVNRAKAAELAEVTNRTNAVTTEANARAAADSLEIQNRNNAIAAEVIARNQAIAAALSNAGGPAGSLLLTFGNSAPTGYLEANGALVSRATYPALFAAIGTTYGVGDGNTTFQLPNVQGDFLRALDRNRGIDPGRTVGHEQMDALQGHEHNVAAYGGSNTPLNTVGGGNNSPSVNFKTVGTVTDGTNGTPRIAGETRPRNMALLACIKI